jgi:hypothetical protein
MEFRNRLLNLYMNIKLTINPEVLYFSSYESVHRNYFLMRDLNIPATDNIDNTKDKRFVNLDFINEI